jgi:hypothetical protein
MQHTVIYIYLILIKPFIYIIAIICYIAYYTFYMHYTYYSSHNSAFNSCVGMHWHWLAVVPDDHQCWIEFLDGWADSAERTKDAMLVPWADGVTRSTRLFIGGVMGDQQEGDKYTGEPCLCHRCFAPRSKYLHTADYEVKTMRKVRQRVEKSNQLLL